MRKVLIIMALFAFVSAFAIEIPECMKDHKPDVERPKTHPKGMAGWTLFYALTTDPGPEYFGWDDEDEGFIAMLAIISAYETWYAARMAEVDNVMEDFETTAMTTTERENSLAEFYGAPHSAETGLLYDIDIRFMGDGDKCWNLVPAEVQEDYFDYMESQ